MSFKYLIPSLSFLLLLITTLTFTPEILQLNDRIHQLQSRNKHLSSLRTIPTPSLSSPPILTHELAKYNSSQVKFSSKCKHSGLNLSAFLFQTISNVYFAINSPQNHTLSFYNHRCQLISNIHNIQIQEVLCDRGVCQSGVLHFLATDHALYSSNQDKNFSAVTQLAKLDGGRIAGGVIRNRGKDKIQIYLSSQDGVIRVFDESGVPKLRIQLDGFNSRILSVKDHHPYPIMVMHSNWISMLDTTKYTEIAPNCPHISDIRYVLAENYYGEAAYIITSSKIYLLDFQISKKKCMVKRDYELEVPITTAQTVSFFSNTIFIDNRVYNLTEKRMYTLDDMCREASLSFLYKKSQGEEIYALKHCCTHFQCNVELFEIKKINEDRSILFWLTIAFIAILFISISFMKKSTINNLDLDDPAQMRDREIQQQIMALAHQAKASSSKQKEKEKKPFIKSSKKQN